MADNPLRVCDICLQLDDHPRHGSVLAEPTGAVDRLTALPNGIPAAAMYELAHPYISEHHLDCGAANGCASCSAQVALAGNVQGDALRTHIQKNSAAHAKAMGS